MNRYPTVKEKSALERIESDRLMSAQATDTYFKAHAENGYLVFVQERDNPLHSLFYFPENIGGRALKAEARPGEYFTFQVGVYTGETLADIRCRWTGPGSLDCFNLSGVDCFGKPFVRRLDVPAIRVQPLWFGIEMPADTREITGTIWVEPADKPAAAVQINIRVCGEPIAEHGDNEPWRHSRLRWLNSRIALDDEVTHPFTPIQRDGRTLSVLGRRVLLADNGLPAGIESFFAPANTALTLEPHPILQAPVTFDIKTGGVPEERTPLRFTQEAGGLVRWVHAYTTGGLTVRLEAALEFDGYMEYRYTVEAAEDTAVEDIRLRIPYTAASGKYLMGLGVQGGLRRGGLDWKWDAQHNQDTLWMGDVNAGLMTRLKDHTYEKPYMLIYYHYQPLNIPDAWNNGGMGGCRVRENGETVFFEAYSGARALKKGEVLTFYFDLCVTPVKPIHKNEHWNDHYFHASGPALTDWLEKRGKTADEPPKIFDICSESGANIINLHHGNFLNPYINYPFFETDLLNEFIRDAHERDLRVKLYYTVKEHTVHMPEFWAFKAIGTELVPAAYETGKSFQGDVPGIDEWMERYLQRDYITAWRMKFTSGPYRDAMEAAVMAPPMSRYNNFYLEGLRWLMEHTGMDGLYLDDTAFDRSVMKRARKILDRHHPGCAIDLHSWNYYKDNTVDNTQPAGYANSMNLYIDQFAFIDRIWFGEGFDYNVAPDVWLIEISGIPFGMMGEMLQDGGNVYRGMLYGMANRLPNRYDPTAMWALWHRFRIDKAVMLGFWHPDCPVKTDCEKTPVTVYRKAREVLLAIASWSAETEQVTLKIDCAALGLNPARVLLTAPEIAGFQTAQSFAPDAPIQVEPGKGWIFILKEGV